MERPQPRDETRRRVLFGLGALGIGAIGAGVVRAVTDGPGLVTQTTRPIAAATTVPLPSTTSPSPAATTPPSSTASTSAQTTTTAREASVLVACRDAWGASPVSGSMVEHAPVRLTVHHTAVSQTSLSQGPARARQHQRYHQSLGWPDLAYHFLVDRTGLAYEGRDVGFRGDTGTEYDPTGHFLVCLEGDFDTQSPTDAQIATVVSLFAWASQRYAIDPVTLAGHDEYATTSCPGSSVIGLLAELRTAVERSAPTAIEVVCGRAGVDLVGSVEAG